MDEVNAYIEPIFRWIHVVAGVLWIGLLYFFNWVNTAFAPTLDAESKKKVVPELLPRTLFWFRWGAAYTWVSGLLLLGLVFYHGNIVWDDPLNPTMANGLALVIAIAFLLISTIIYDKLYKGPLKPPGVGFWAGWILAGAVILGFKALGFSPRGYHIHLGAMFGTFMAFNVWMRIWPSQQKIITAVKNGEAPDGDLVALAGTRSKHNTYMSVPLIFTMVNQSTFKYYDWWKLWVIVLVGWLVVYALYQKSKTVKGF